MIGQEIQLGSDIDSGLGFVFGVGSGPGAGLHSLGATESGKKKILPFGHLALWPNG